MSNTTPIPQPMNPSLRLSASSRTPWSITDASKYRRLIGRLLYLQISRPDISFSVHKLSQYLANPYTTHLRVVLHLLRYLKGTAGQGILLKATVDFQLKAFVDSDGVLARILDVLLLIFVFLWVILLSHGKQRNNLLFLIHRLKLSIMILLLFLVRLHGFFRF